MSESEYGNTQEEMRMCSTCRMPVSVLATRCRHCGESLGRPRKAEEKFTVSDLGGESTSEYTVSGDLMDAMESFRLELSSDEEAKQQKPDRTSRWFSRDSKTGEKKSHFSDLELPTGNLDDLANSDIGYTTPPPRPVTKPTRPAASGDSKKYIAIAAVVVVVLILGALFGGGITQMIASSPEEQVAYENRALQMLNAGRPTIEAMEEARKALDHDLSSENRAVMAQVREQFIAEMNGILGARRYDKDALDNAFALSDRAAKLDSDASLQALVEQANKDVNYHRFLLMSIDRQNGTATFDLNNPYVDDRQQTVSEGDMLQGRFKVDRITSELVRLSDQEIDVPGGKRRLVARPFKPVAGA